MEKRVEVPCDFCGRPVLARARARLQGKGRFHARCAQVVRTMGRKNPNYKGGGRSYHSERVSAERRAVIHERDGHRCCKCGRGGVKLDVHHVVPVRDGGPDTNENLASLCRRCHNRIEHGRDHLVWPPRERVRHN